MKKRYLKSLQIGLLLGVALSNVVLAQKYIPKYQRDDDKTIERLAKYVGEDGWIEFRQDDNAVQASEFFTNYKDNLGIGEGYELKLLNQKTMEPKLLSQQYQLYYRGLPVEGAYYTLISQEGRLQIAVGRIILDLSRDVASPTKESEALATALAEIGTTVEKIQKEGGKTDGELLLARCGEDFTKESYCLAYAFNLTDEKDKLPYRIYVDATTNKVVKRLPLYQNCFESPSPVKPLPITAEVEPTPLERSFSPLVASTFIPNHARYLAGQGVLNFDTEPVGSNFGLRFNSQSQNSALQVQRDLNNNGQFDDGDVTNPNTNWGNNSPNATTAHWVCQRMYQYMLNTHGRNGVNNNGTIARVSVEVPAGDFAQWQHPTNRMLIGFRNGTGTSLSTIDIVAHELMHGYSNNMAGGNGLNGTAESSTLNEALSDMFGTVVENQLLPNDWNWTLGEDAWLLRNMSNPELSTPPQARTFQGPNWGGTEPPHQRNGFLNRWFFLISEGENVNPGQRVYPIGMDRAARIVFYTMNAFLQPSTSFANFKDASLYVAELLYGTCSHEARQVINAWNNVNFSTNFTCTPDCNFTINPTASPAPANCNSPITLTANCSGPGCDYIDYNWNGPGIPAGQNPPGQTISVTTPNGAGTNTYTVSITKVGCNFSTADANVITNCQPPCNSNGTGLTTNYYNGQNLQGSPFATFSGNIDISGNQSDNLPGSNVAANDVSARWEGKVEAPVNGTYNFNVRTDDGVRVWFDNQQRVDDFGYYPPTDHNFSVNLTAGQKYNVKVEWKQGGGGFEAKMFWSYPGQGNQIVPACWLFPGGSPPPPNCNFSASANPSTINTSPNVSITLNALCSGGDCGSVNYQWSGNGASSSSSSYTLNAPGSNGSYTYTVTLSKPGCNNSTASVTVNVSSVPPANNCLNLGDQCSGNSSEVRNYSMPLSSGGNKTVTFTYRSHEGPGTLNFVLNSTPYTIALPQTTLSYATITLPGNYPFGTSNTIALSSGGGFICFREICVDGGGGGCQTPNPPTVSASSSTPPSNLSASGCNGTVNWSHGASGANVTVNPTVTTTYTATCTENGCTSSASNGVIVTVGGGGSDCLNLSDLCSGNSQEIRNYSMPLSSGGNKTVTFTYRSHEGPGTLRFVLNGNLGIISLPQTTLNYSTITLPGTYFFNSSNSIALSSGGGFICFREICVSSSGGRLGVAEEPATDSPELTVSPNPNDGEFVARFYVEPGRKATLRVSDIQGREVWKKNLTGEGAHSESVRLPAQSIGSFVLLLDKEATGTKGKAEFKRVIVVK
ncbi:M4 family metallopeptidase [Persicitalea sp.]|uniref:M4 family metallopeptidase n=1 Tax=Persicitalea sp. TaxID=3100273 RepID=UPI003592EE20